MFDALTAQERTSIRRNTRLGLVAALIVTGLLLALLGNTLMDAPELNAGAHAAVAIAFVCVSLLAGSFAWQGSQWWLFRQVRRRTA